MKPKTLDSCVTQSVKVEHRGIRRFIPYCTRVGSEGVITKGMRQCKARGCPDYRELEITAEPTNYDFGPRQPEIERGYDDS